MTPTKTETKSKKFVELGNPQTYIATEEEKKLLREAKISLTETHIIGALPGYGVCSGTSCKKPTYKINYKDVDCIICASPDCLYGQILK